MKNQEIILLDKVKQILENDLKMFEQYNKIYKQLFIHKLIIAFLACSLIFFSRAYLEQKYTIIKCLENNPTYTLTQCKQK